MQEPRDGVIAHIDRLVAKTLHEEPPAPRKLQAGPVRARTPTELHETVASNASRISIMYSSICTTSLRTASTLQTRTRADALLRLRAPRRLAVIDTPPPSQTTHSPNQLPHTHTPRTCSSVLHTNTRPPSPSPHPAPPHPLQPPPSHSTARPPVHTRGTPRRAPPPRAPPRSARPEQMADEVWEYVLCDEGGRRTSRAGSWRCLPGRPPRARTRCS